MCVCREEKKPSPGAGGGEGIPRGEGTGKKLMFTRCSPCLNYLCSGGLSLGGER